MFTQFKSTTEWGPSFWYVLHTSAMTYPDYPSETYVRAMMDFIGMLPDLLPCPSCQQHARDYVTSFSSFYLYTVCSSRQSLFEFWVVFHNVVNQRLLKRTFDLPTARNMYSGPVTGWGPAYWFFLHMTSFSPLAGKPVEFKRFLDMFSILLPTAEARNLSIQYMTENQKRLALVVSNENNIFFFWFQFHNYVNTILRKRLLTFERVKELYKIN